MHARGLVALEFVAPSFRSLKMRGSGEATHSLSFSLLFHLELHLVVHRVRAVLLMLSGWRLAGHHLHLHSARQK